MKNKIESFVNEHNAREVYEFLLHYPRQHVPGSVREISHRIVCPTLAVKFTRPRFNDAELRELVRFARLELDLLICSNGKGYWIAQKPEDLLETADHLKGRAKKLFQVVGKFEARYEAWITERDGLFARRIGA